MPTDLLAFFLWLGASGTISGLIAWLLANWKWFADLGDEKPLAQQAIKLTISVALSALSYGLATYIPAETVQRINPLFAAIAAGVNVIVMQTTQAAHGWYADKVTARRYALTLQAVEVLEYARLDITPELLSLFFPDKPEGLQTAIAATHLRSVVGAGTRATATLRTEAIESMAKAANITPGTGGRPDLPTIEPDKDTLG